MVAETGPRAAIAEKVSKELLKWFRWETVGPKNSESDCLKHEKHARANKKQKHTHPADVVFRYRDPYLNRDVFLNTDLKSYTSTSITKPNVRTALRSIAQAIDCARISAEWKERYEFEDGDVRGLLFVYNHDATFDDGFERFLIPPKSKSKETADADVAGIPLDAGQTIHIIEPRTISYLQTVLSDTAFLVRDQTFPIKDYYFYYPDQKLHKAHSEIFARPATVELLCGPYLIIGHDIIQHREEKSGELKQTLGPGFVVYYNRPGISHLEFMYLFDVLSSYQILNGENQIRLRVAHHSPHLQIQSNYKKAKAAYIRDWGSDDYIASKIDAIDFQVLDVNRTAFSKANLGWE
jgi:hypothetical protein